MIIAARARRAAAALTLALALLLCAAPFERAAAEVSLFNIKNALIQFLFSQLGSPGSAELTAEAVRTPPDGGTELLGFAISDAEGPWLTAERILFRFDGDRLLTGVVDIPELRVVGLDFRRLPNQPEGAAIATGSTPQAPGAASGFAWPRSPLTLHLRAMTLEGARISDRVTPQALRFSGRAAIRDEGDEQSLSLSVTREDSVAGEIVLEYLRRFAANTLALRFEADEAAGGLAAAALGLPQDAGARVAIMAEGPPEAWRMTLAAAVEGLFEAAGGARVDYAGPITADVDLALTPGPRMDATLAAALTPDARLAARVAEDAAGRVRVEQGFVAARDFRADVSGFYDRSSGAMDFALDAAAQAGLAALAPGLSFERVAFAGGLKGQVGALTATGLLTADKLASAAADVEALRAEADIAIGETAVRFTARGDAQGLRLDRIDPSVVGPARFTLDGAADAERLTLERFTLAAAPLDLTAAGRIDYAAAPGAAALTLDAAVRDLAAVAAAYGVALDGDLRVSGDVSGPLDAPRARLDGRFDQLSYRPEGGAPLRLAGGRLSADVTARGGAAEGPLRFEIRETPAGAVAASAALSVDADALRLGALTADALGLTARGGLAYALKTGLVDGRLDADARDLARLGRFLGVELGGAARVGAALSGAGGVQAASLTLEGADLRVAGQDAPRLAAQAEIADVAAGGPITARAEVGGLDFGLGAPFDGVLTADGRLDALRWTAVGEAHVSRGGERRLAAGVDARGKAALQPARTVLDIEAALVGFGADRGRLLEPATITVSPQGLAASPIRLALPRDGRAELRIARAASGAVSADATVEALDLTLLRDYAGAPIDAGRFDGDLAFDIRGAASGGRLAARAVGLRPLGGADIPPLDLRLDGVWEAGRLTLDLLGAGPFQQPFKGRVALPMVGTQGGGVAWPMDGALDGMIDWRGDLAELWALTPPSDHLLRGPVTLDLRVGGVLGAPALSGGLAVTDGRYDNLTLGTIVTALNAASDLGREGALAFTWTAKDGASGVLAGEAAVALTAPFAVEASLALDKAVLLRRDDATAKLSGALAAVGPMDALSVNGAFTVDGAEVNLGGLGGVSIADLGEVVILGEEAESDSDAAARRAAEGRGATLALSVAADKTIRVHGRGLESLWSMDLAVSGQASAPQIVGAITRDSGRLDFLGARFDFTRGSVAFVGDADPRLDIQFARRDNDVEGRIGVSGRASDPTIDFSSTPTLPQEEVLPRVLFGRSRQALAPGEAAQLAAGVATLLTGSSGVAGLLGGGLGVDAGFGGVSAGQHLGDGLYVGAEQSYDGTGGSVVIELEVLENTTIDAEIGQDGGSSLGASFRYDF